MPMPMPMPKCKTTSIFICRDRRLCSFTILKSNQPILQRLPCTGPQPQTLCMTEDRVLPSCSKATIDRVPRSSWCIAIGQCEMQALALCMVMTEPLRQGAGGTAPLSDKALWSLKFSQWSYTAVESSSRFWAALLSHSQSYCSLYDHRIVVRSSC